MTPHPAPDLHAADLLGPVGVALAFIALMSLFREPARQRFNAVFVAGAGAAYLGAGLGPWEFILPVAVTACAYRGLTSYRFIGLAWLLHTAWDVVHHFYANPIIPFAPTSSAGCAICDTVLALWFFANAPSVFELARRRPAAALPS
ncbi:MAG TPA: DUF6010 family protein [Polyangiaceae bacterium]|nr:DUF6010 family protein [Polyangiaceae bacterium]